MLLSRTYPPHKDLEPFIRRHYVFDAALPDDFMIEDSLLSENAFVRILLKGDALDFQYLDREDEKALPKPPERKALPRAKPATRKKPSGKSKAKT